VTFKSVAASYIDAHKSAWRNAKHRAQWTSTLETYAYPVIGELPVSAVGTAHVSAILEPIWTTKPETASRVRGRIEAILDYARARELRAQAGTAAPWAALARLLPDSTATARLYRSLVRDQAIAAEAEGFSDETSAVEELALLTV